MSEQTHPKILMVGAGSMSVQYSKVLTALGVEHDVFGRGAESAASFEEATGVAAGTGPLSDQIAAYGPLPEVAIVTVNAFALAEVTKELSRAGVKRILVEKPGVLTLDELADVLAVIEAQGTSVHVGYNRRFIESVRHARKIIKEDGGPISVSFDFSEPSRRIAELVKPQIELDTWFYGNSSHVVDLAFHFAGAPSLLDGRVSGGVSWHPAAGVFVGSGEGQNGSLLSWHANWMSPGRWGLEVRTSEHRLIFQPIEKLRVQTHASFAEVDVELDDEADRNFKPGFLRQTRAFLFGEEIEFLPTLQDHGKSMAYYETVRLGGRQEFK